MISWTFQFFNGGGSSPKNFSKEKIWIFDRKAISALLKDLNLSMKAHFGQILEKNSHLKEKIEKYSQLKMVSSWLKNKFK